ncbi:MAG TPA: hypothetical protein VKB93_21085 [Thermoanaerobaculia bacterium]|nr:hypothetical protein [Thermoanaerobaculia bacterium]
MTRTFLVFVLVVSLAAGAAQRPIPTRFDTKSIKPIVNLLHREPDLREVPPVAQRVAVRLLEKETGEGNAIVFAEFARGVPAPTVLTMELERGKATLRDDGNAPDDKAQDGIHSGYLRIDAKQLAAANERLLRATKPIPIFVGRQLAATFTAQRVEPGKIRDLRDIPPYPSRANFADVELRSRDIPNLNFPVMVDFDPGDLIPLFPPVDPPDVNPAASLVINDPNVVDDPVRTFNPCTNAGTPMGKWTFGHVMEQMANTPMTGITPEAFTRRWLKRWEVSPLINDLQVPARPNVVPLIVDPWPKNLDGTLNLAKAPFRLVAVVYRGDLAQNLIYGGGSAGEARLVFALTDPNTCAPKRFLVIFEYGIQQPSCVARKAWGQAWFDLKNNQVGSPAYNAALEALTVQFTEAGTNPSQFPNQSSLNQLRTNEFVISPDWELREFHLAGGDADVGHLRETTVVRSPDFPLNNQPVTADFINQNAADILNDTYDVDPEFPIGTPFLGAISPIPFPPGNVFWNGPGINTPNTRHKFSLNTCNGCHGGETATFFTHISEQGQLSGFLTGITVPDPAGEMVNRTFNDLELRKQKLAQLLNQPCFLHLFFEPLRMSD